jgi:4-diphosphocytidyl-2-C-methyl-D-erythritol kinase
VIELRANAKVNLWLRVVGRRPDGYHDIETIFQSVGLADRVSCRLHEAREIDVSMSYEGVPELLTPKPEDNLVWKAARVFLDRTRSETGVSVDVTKRIPTGGGLGGGSADAAATLIALNELLEKGMQTGELQMIAAELGSDTSFCIGGGTALGTGRGEVLYPIADVASMAFAIGLSDDPLLTSEVYERWEPRADERPGVGEMISALAGGPDAVGPLLRNDLESAAFSLRPELADKKEVMTGAGACGALIGGSGASIIGLCRDEAHAAEVAASVGDAFDRVVVAPAVTASVQPA